MATFSVGTSTLTVSGVLDSANRDELVDVLLPLLSRGDTVIVDIRAATFADATAVEVLVAARHHLRQHRGSLVVLASADVHDALTSLTIETLVQRDAWTPFTDWEQRTSVA